MILTKNDIMKEIKEGSIVIEPFDLSNVSVNSIDLTLGNKVGIYDEYVLSADGKNEMSYTELEDGESFLLEPGRLYLFTTREKTTFHKHVPIMFGKSSIGRLGIQAHICAGFGDIGFDGYLTLEIMAMAQPVLIKIGMKICQLGIFEPSSIPSQTYKDLGRYNNNDDAPISSKGV